MEFFSIQYILYAYLYISVALLLFNIGYIYSLTWREKARQRRTRRLKKWLRKYFIFPEEEEHEKANDRQKRRLLRKLQRTSYLISFGDALESLEQEIPNELNRWIDEEGTFFNELAAYYQDLESMQRAYIAWLLERFHVVRVERTELLQILLAYLENSTIYCRENVMKAIYRSANVDAVESAVQYLNDARIHHNEKLLSDGLLSFRGNKEELAYRLWSHHKQWDSEIMCPIIQFITRLNPSINIGESFKETLKDSNGDMEVRIALVRYFARVKYEPVRELLLSYALEDDTLAIVSATALANYAGDDTIEVLRKAVCSRNWYIRSNAAVSLIILTRNHPDREKLLECPDRYGREILAYSLKRA